jgi:tRNA G26 N,N-dimethylase Trm1
MYTFKWTTNKYKGNNSIKNIFSLSINFYVTIFFKIKTRISKLLVRIINTKEKYRNKHITLLEKILEDLTNTFEKKQIIKANND